MKLFVKIFFILFIYFLALPLGAQEYFQQQADYKIAAKLDTLTQKLSVNCTLNYTNNSPEDLDHIILHVWWNAFNDKSSAYSAQILEMGQRDFFFAQDEDLGGYDNLNIIYNNEEISYEPYNDGERIHSDIIKLNLSSSIKAGETVNFEMEYILSIPFAFTRPGYIDNLYQITQWYPKPAVYDHEGWHPMPYLEYGEYYSEYGNYEVEITVPMAFSLAHTGTLDGDKTDLKIKERTRTEFITAENVHDFAWFGSEYYVNYAGGVEIDEEMVNIQILVKEDYDDWQKMMDHAKQALQFFSEEVGTYPYPSLSIVQAAEGDQSGMEYPMVTILSTAGNDQNLDHLVAHEIGHNWFYGILASNERRFPWMDEGLTTYFDHKYNDLHYESSDYFIELPKFILGQNNELSLRQSAVLNLQRMGRAQKMNLSSEEFDPFNYLAINYEKASWAFRYLQAYLGDDVFEDCIKGFYEKWKFKHPYPKDLQKSFEEISSKNLSWFFEGMMNTAETYDLVLRNVENREVTIYNKGPLSIPFHLTQYDDESNIISNVWYEGIPVEESRVIEIEQKEDSDLISINGAVPFLDLNRKNNHSKKKTEFKFIGSVENSHVRSVNYLPSILVNQYDGLMLGLNVYNNIFPQAQFRWLLNANYGFKSNSLAGIFAVEKDFLIPRENFRKLTFGLNGRRFHYNENKMLDYDLAYNKIVPSITAHFSKDLFRNSSFSYKAHIINEEQAVFGFEGYEGNETNTSVIHQLNYVASSQKRLSRNDFLVQLEYESYSKPNNEDARYLKLSLDYRKKVYYNINNTFRFRIFGGYFPINTERESSAFYNVFSRGSFALASQGFTDHTYEGFFGERTGTADGPSSQIQITEGGFKNAFGSAFSTGMSNDYLLASNFSIDLPFTVFRTIVFSPYMDLAYSSTKGSNSDPLKAEFYYSGGMSFRIGEALEFYIPVFHSEVFKSNYSGMEFFAKMSFRLDYEMFNLWRVRDNPGVILK